jgi:hypothetical protein
MTNHQCINDKNVTMTDSTICVGNKKDMFALLKTDFHVTDGQHTYFVNVAL